MAEPAFNKVERTLSHFAGRAESESSWRGPFTFICASDTQFGMMDSVDGRLPVANQGWEREVALTRQAIAAANRMEPKPKFFTICGDLIDAMPGTHHRAAQMRDFKSVMSELNTDIPLVCVCGNHDVGDQPTVETISSYRQDIGQDYYSFVCGGCLFIVINSQYYENRSQVAELAAETDHWLDTLLAKAASYKHAVIFQHIPWFTREPNEEKIYYNIAQPLRERMLSKFYDAGIAALFCGHYHRNAGGFYSKDDGRKMELVVTSAVGAQQGTDTHGLRVVQVQDSQITHKYYAISEIPSKVDLN